MAVPPPAEATTDPDDDHETEVESLGENLRHYWRLNDAPSATGAADAVASTSGGVPMDRSSNVSFGAAGAFGSGLDTAASFTAGSSGPYGMYAATAFSGITSASVTMWVKPTELPPAAGSGNPGYALLFDTKDADSGYWYDSGLTIELGADGSSRAGQGSTSRRRSHSCDRCRSGRRLR